MADEPYTSYTSYTSYTPYTSYDDERKHDASFRRLLAEHDEPVTLAPPPMVRHRLLARLPAAPPAQAAAQARRRARWRRGGQVCIMVLIVALLALGSWGVFVDSAGLAQLFGAVSTGLGQFVLALVLLAKPLVHSLLVGNGIGVIGWLLACIVPFWGCWRLLRQAPLMHPSRIRVEV